MIKEPLVSISCFAYNQEKYIRECLDGLISQQTDFPFEIVVHDDASTDDTANIIREYEAKYPEIVKPIYEQENQFSKHDGSLGRIIYGACRGKYIAECDGDDYWIDPLKLQKQVSFLEQNPDYGLCYGIARQYDQETKSFSVNRGKDYISFEHLLTHHSCIPTVTTCYRKDLFFKYRNEFLPRCPRWKMGDLAVWLWFAANSKIKFFPEITSVYRVLKSSSAHTNDIEKQMAFYKSGYDCSSYFSREFLGKELPPFEEHQKRAWLYSTKAHDRKKAFEEYKQIPVKNLKYTILTILHSNPITFAFLRLYYSKKYKQ